MNVIEIEGLRKEYRRLRGGRTLAVDGLDLAVGAGGVFGFLGPNGSGKTTTIRCLLALGRPTEGTCRVFGRDSQTELHDVITKIGSIVEAPALFPTFSGRRNLELLGRLYDIPRTRVDQVLETVDLVGRDRDLVKTYSLGMRQRLAIGAALLKDPQLLILDEPANGLDPAGIREVRDLLRRLAAEGRTIFVSSHLLSEVQQVCDQVAILSRGRCVAAGPVDEVLSQGRAGGVLVRVGDAQRAVVALQASGFTATLAGELVRVEIDAADAARVSEALARRGLYPSELRPDAIDLETVFLQLTESEKKEAAA
ncbi:MAG: ABC transporter ATP-binding protein [Actinomycetota bacterium]|nr:ABC transporter ATP-binding protein [Actinomycetota bacterium]